MITIARMFAAILIAATGLTPPPYAQIFPALSIRPDARCEAPLPPNEPYHSQMRLAGPESISPGDVYTVTITIKNAGCVPFGLFRMSMSVNATIGNISHQQWTIYRGLGSGSMLTDTQVLTMTGADVPSITVSAGSAFEVTYHDEHGWPRYETGHAGAMPIVIVVRD